MRQSCRIAPSRLLLRRRHRSSSNCSVTSLPQQPPFPASHHRLPTHPKRPEPALPKPTFGALPVVHHPPAVQTSSLQQPTPTAQPGGVPRQAATQVHLPDLPRRLRPPGDPRPAPARAEPRCGRPPRGASLPAPALQEGRPRRGLPARREAQGPPRQRVVHPGG